MSGLDILFRILGGAITGAIVYVVLAYVSFFEASQTVALASAVVAFLLVAIFGHEVFKLVMKLLDDIW